MTLCVRPRVKFANEYNHNFCLVVTTFYPFTLMFCTLSYHSTRDLYYEMRGYFFTIHSSYSQRFYIFVVVGFIYLACKYFVIVFHNFFLYIVNLSNSVHMLVRYSMNHSICTSIKCEHEMLTFCLIRLSL